MSYPNDQKYTAFLSELKARIHQAQFRATLSVNQALIQLYWQLGQSILPRQQQES